MSRETSIQQAGESEQHCRQCRDRRAAGHTHDKGIGERIAQQYLHQYAGNREQAAGRECSQCARQSQVHDHRIGPANRCLPGPATAVAGSRRRCRSSSDNENALERREREQAVDRR